MDPVYLRLSEPSGKLPVGASRFFGNPDLPAGCAYPSYTDDDGDEYPYFFVCQINMEEIAPYDPGGFLPRTGLLSFFAKIDHYLGYYAATDCIGGTISGRDAVRVMYFPTCDSLEEAVLTDGDGNPSSPGELRIDFSLRPGTHDEHAVFAPPSHRPWETWDHPFEDRMILLQVDSCRGKDFDLNFMDVGVLDFLISPSALARHDFDDVRAIVLSS